MPMNNSFNNLGITEPILRGLRDMGFEEPTEVQKKAIPHVLNQEDVIVISKTGTGKTAVFGVPMLQLTEPGVKLPEGLILTPTRELAAQVDGDLKKIAKHLSHKTTAVYGQHNMNMEIQDLSRGVSIVTGTPGRVYDHIRQGNLKTKQVRFLVLDEADRMLDMGFIDQVEQIIRTLPKQRVTLLFSATIPDEVKKICRKHMKNPVTIEIESQAKTVETTQQVYYRVNENEKNMQLNRLLLIEQPESCIIFCNTRNTVDKVQRYLSRKGYLCYALHGDIPQTKRTKTLQKFKQGEFCLLIATDVAARGIHIEDLSLVINYDVPLEKDSYVHRIGRTGRAGNQGRAITLVTGEDIMDLYEIEEYIGTMIPEGELPTEADLYHHKESAKQWIQVNTPKTATKQKSTEKRDKSVRSYNNSERNQPAAYVKADKNIKAAVKEDALRSQQVKNVSPPTSTTPTRSSKQPGKTGLERNTVEATIQASAKKKPLFKRLLQRLFGN